MRVVSYESAGGTRSGLQIGQRVVDATTAAQSAGLGPTADWTSTRSVIASGRDTLAKLDGTAHELAGDESASLDLTALVLAPPIGDPDKIVCLGLNYRAHAAEATLEVPDAPTLFAKFRNSLIGPYGTIVLPAVSGFVDYEAELAVVIGTTAKDVSEADALEYVAGVMALNDVSARDLQTQTSQWLPGKALDTFAPCGPALVLLDEIEDIQALGIKTRLNGELVQDGNTSEMIFAVAETVAYLSRLMTLVPGDVIATGTPAGVGFERVPQLRLHDGDVVEVEIEGVGSLRNTVVGWRQHER